MKPQLTRAIHDYFFAKSLEKLRPGGVMALITSRYTMDKQDDTIRRHLAEHAPILLGAIRLPNTAFKGNAGRKSPPIFCSCASARPERSPRAMPGAAA
jgi:adenine-specific DNA methylase